jgi:transcriptional regulator with XRE-family HTH domain
MRKSKDESSTNTLARIKKEMNLPRVTKSARNEILLENHQLHLGLFKRISQRLGVHPSYVSKVASGSRTSESVMRILMRELNALR